ncbi:MAG: FmdE family protein [Phycisphaerae bacterium]
MQNQQSPAALPDDLQACIEFHGHLCPGVVIGYCASKLALRELSAGRSGDEEFIAIVENDTCAVNAIQWLTGCTFGKGNLFFHDYGKMVFTFASRESGRSLRLRLRDYDQPSAEELPEHLRRQRRIEFMLSRDPAVLFDVKQNPLDELPEPARIRDSFACDMCGERAMVTRACPGQLGTLCIPCYEKHLENPDTSSRSIHES